MPSVLPDAVVTNAATPVIINVLANDTGTNLTITSFSNPANGSLVFNGDKTFTYTPMAGFIGADSFAYTVRDAQGTPANAEVTISVVPNTGATIATDDVVEVIAGGAGVVIPVLANDITAGAGMLQIIAVSGPGHGAINVLPDQTIRYVPQGGFTGIDSFNYTVVDGQGSSASATVTVKVLTENSAPIAGGDTFTIEAGQPTMLVVLANDSDPDGGPLQIVGFTMPSQGSLVFNPDQTFTYTSAAGYLGNDQFTYTIRDNRGASAQASVTLSMRETIEAPVAAADQVTTEAGTPVTVDVLANDTLPAGQEIGIVAVTLPYRGKLVFNADKTITYTPNAGFVGIDDFTYTISNGKGGTAKARVTVEVTAAAATAATYANGYGYRRRIVVPASSAKGGAHANFPLWVELADGWLKSAVDGGKVASQDGHDLRFELEDGTKLAHEIEHYDAGAGKLGAWVRLPELRDDAATTLMLYYGKAELEVGEATPQAVWQDYLAVWHLPGGDDAAVPGRSLTASGSPANDPDGLGAGALSLNGNGMLTIADTSWLQGLPALSVQLRCKAAGTGHDQGQLGAGPDLFSSNDGDLLIRYQSVGFADSQPQNLLHSSITTTAGKLRASSQSNTQSTNWQSITLAWQSGDAQSHLYLDGEEAQPSFTTSISGGASTQIQGPVYLGASSRDSAAGGWAGLLDEVRFRPTKLADEWIAAEHLNQSAPALFYGIGAEETIEAASDSIVALPFDLKTPAGKWIEIDVLAAVQIPPGMPSPTIQAVSQPANGTISVINDQIRYSPAASFVGEDGFTFTLAAAGRTSAAQVRVIVEPSVSQEEEGSGSTASYLRTVDVANANQLTNALNNATAGDDIVLANGTYNSTFTLSASGTAANPIRIRAQNPNNVVIQGRLILAGRYAIVQHLRWQNFSGGDSIVEVFGRDCRVLRNWFIGCGVSNGAQRGIVRLQPGAHDCEIGWNEFRQFAQRAICVRATSGGALRALVRRNYIKVNSVVSGFSGVAIGIGGDSDQGAVVRTELQAVVEYNLIEDVGGGMGNVLQAKCSKNIFRFNTARNCPSRIEIRTGRYNDVIANACLNSMGPVVHGIGHRMIGNYNDGARSGNWSDMSPMAGQLDLNDVANNATDDRQPYAAGCLLAGNIGILRLGGGTANWQAARNNIIEEHVGNVVDQNSTGTTYRNLTVPVPPYVVLQPSDVGPAAVG